MDQKKSKFDVPCVIICQDSCVIGPFPSADMATTWLMDVPNVIVKDRDDLFQCVALGMITILPILIGDEIEPYSGQNRTTATMTTDWATAVRGIVIDDGTVDFWVRKLGDRWRPAPDKEKDPSGFAAIAPIIGKIEQELRGGEKNEN